MAKAKFTLIETIRGKFPTDIWFCEDKQVFDVWRNKAKLFQNFPIPEDSNFEKTFSDIRLFIYNLNDNFYGEDNISLVDYLRLNNLKLTTLEKDVIEAIMGEGSFYEESADWKDVDGHHIPCVKGSCFIGWDIDEKEIPGCRGAISSLVRKGILTVADDDCNGNTIQAYYIHQTPEFVEGGYYHQLDIPAELIK